MKSNEEKAMEHRLDRSVDFRSLYLFDFDSIIDYETRLFLKKKLDIDLEHRGAATKRSFWSVCHSFGKLDKKKKKD